MTRVGSARIGGYATLAALGLLGALVARRPELAVLAAPFALALALGLGSRGETKPHVRLTIDRERALEGDDVGVRFDVRSDEPIERLELMLVVPDGLEVADGSNAHAIRLGWDDDRELKFTLRCARWGSYALGDVRLRARGRLGLLVWEDARSFPSELRVYPQPEALRRLVQPRATQPFTGNDVARVQGDGLEFADLRPFLPGDRVRSINWRASARRDELIVNLRHPERNADVVLFLDSFVDARRGDRSSLELAVRAAASIASRYLERRDRVGLVSFGGILRWLTPGMGLAHRYRIVDALLETEVVFNYAWKDVSVIPARTLPPQALVVAVTPLLDERSVGALLDLRARGYDLAIVEVSPLPFAHPGEDELEQLAYRLWLLHRQELRSRYESLGVAVVSWSDETSLEGALEGVRSFRRHVRLVRA